MKPLLALFAVAAVSMATSRSADACSLSEPISPLSNLYGASSVIYGEVVVADQDGYLVKRRDTISGTHTADVRLPFSECDSLRVGEYVALAITNRTSFVTYPVVHWPQEPENQALITAFANAKSDAEIGKVLAAHVKQGWASYVDFPQIALFLKRTPSVVTALSKRDAKYMLLDLERHPRAKANARAALAK